MKKKLIILTSVLLIGTLVSCDKDEKPKDGAALLKAEKENILSFLRKSAGQKTAFEKNKKSTQLASTTNPVYQDLQNPPVRSATNGILDTELRVAYSDQEIWNVKDHQTLTVRLRNYEGLLVPPTLKVKPGDLLRVKMKNDLPPLGHVSCDPYGGMHHTSDDPCEQKNPQSFNTTNLHTHGLHVSPKDSSDNVLVHIMPSCEFQNHIQIPENHPQGTFWYHGHVHGSTAVQVSSGMGGALIVEGGMDTIPEIKAADEKIFVFQQIPYTQDSDGQFGVEDFDASFGPGIWDKGVDSHGWRTMINGQTYPIIRMKSGEVQRWRLIHAGVREKIELELDGHQLHEIALDGISLGRVETKGYVELQPGYRSDILIKANEVSKTDTLFLIDRETQKESSLLDEYESPKILAIVIISTESKDMKLPTSDELAAYRPFKTIKESELEGLAQEVWFNIDVNSTPTCFTVNGRPFSMDNPPRVLKLNSASEWKITSQFVNHPFHIHVNSFEIFRVKKADGQEIIFDPPVWRDTYLIQQGDTVFARSRYEDFDGKFVLHCHILDHEDQGMMELVNIVGTEAL
ncbi:multicopper oxidase domain-containing protein [Fulvivirga sp. 29W222]|uniref:Multicopper oxidase domain-containing protein n=1 Tax=Fulvivirga marina TaxID=2494733 RepID=A0A937FTV3_9BACT|nr:multicopper oxidase domain-containing protein [Fulvivirga marina]MBL6444712.1 multicopper oxidase domain-containing protein [Fulvivirga marina]